MPEVYRKTIAEISALEAHTHQWSLPAVGFRFHRGD